MPPDALKLTDPFLYSLSEAGFEVLMHQDKGRASTSEPGIEVISPSGNSYMLAYEPDFESAPPAERWFFGGDGLDDDELLMLSREEAAHALMRGLLEGELDDRDFHSSDARHPSALFESLESTRAVRIAGYRNQPENGLGEQGDYTVGIGLALVLDKRGEPTGAVVGSATLYGGDAYETASRPEDFDIGAPVIRLEFPSLTYALQEGLDELVSEALQKDRESRVAHGPLETLIQTLQDEGWAVRISAQGGDDIAAIKGSQVLAVSNDLGETFSGALSYQRERYGDVLIDFPADADTDEILAGIETAGEALRAQRQQVWQDDYLLANALAQALSERGWRVEVGPDKRTLTGQHASDPHASISLEAAASGHVLGTLTHQLHPGFEVEISAFSDGPSFEVLHSVLGQVDEGFHATQDGAALTGTALPSRSKKPDVPSSEVLTVALMLAAGVEIKRADAGLAKALTAATGEEVRPGDVVFSDLTESWSARSETERFFPLSAGLEGLQGAESDPDKPWLLAFELATGTDASEILPIEDAELAMQDAKAVYDFDAPLFHRLDETAHALRQRHPDYLVEAQRLLGHMQAREALRTARRNEDPTQSRIAGIAIPRPAQGKRAAEAVLTLVNAAGASQQVRFALDKQGKVAGIQPDSVQTLREATGDLPPAKTEALLRTAAGLIEANALESAQRPVKALER